MSDFDREAEREKLREQFGDEEDREHSERLSELLLKGATMTDKHCTECSDPIFRHEGREFCPSCGREVGDGDASRATAGQAAARDPTANDPAPASNADGDTGDAVEVDLDAPDEAGTTADGQAGPAADPGAAAADAERPATDATGATGGSGSPTPDVSGTDGRATGNTGVNADTQPSARQQSGTTAPDAGSDGLLPARQHLTVTVNRLAQQAAAEEDPGRKREFLAATREAAEALEAVRDAE